MYIFVILEHFKNIDRKNIGLVFKSSLHSLDLYHIFSKKKI